jgi:hypothetical protein
MDDPRKRGPSASPEQDDELAATLLGSTLRAARALRRGAQVAVQEVVLVLDELDGAPTFPDGFWDVAMARAVAKARTIPGVVIELGPRVYRFAAPIVLDTPVALRGAGARLPHLFASDDAEPTTVLHFVNGTSGILFQGVESIDDATFASRLERLVVRGSWSRRQADIVASQRRVGVDVRSTHATLHEVTVELFSGDAVRISGASRRSPEGRADAWLLEGCSLVRCGGDGLAVREGALESEGFALRVHSVGNGGRGFVDESRVGNLYVACHASANGRAGFVRLTPSPLPGEASAGCPVYLACFSEGAEERPDSLGTPAVVLGGNLSAHHREVASSAPPSQNEPAPDARRAFDPHEPPSGPRVRALVASDGRTLDLRAFEALLPFLPLGPATGVRGRAASSETLPSSASAARESEADPGVEVPPRSAPTDRLSFGDGLFLGRPEAAGAEGERVFIETGRAIPDESAFERPVGSRVYHPSPVAGGFEGWVKVEAGVGPRTWRTFGRIDR